MILLKNSARKEIAKIEPSFGYTSLKEEIQSLNDKIEISSTILSRQSPQFIFGKLKTDTTSKQFIHDLEVTQNKIKDLLSSNTFLKDVLEMIYPQENIVIHSPIKQIKIDKEEIDRMSYLVAANIWNGIQGEPVDFYNNFILGMKESEKNLDNLNALADSFNYQKL